MDLLTSLNLEVLPEQQTRTLHLIEANPEFQLNLGFDACCSCGTTLTDGTGITCLACKRVQYCSEACRAEDAGAATLSSVGQTYDDEETALGHTAVICSILNLCNDDEAVEGGDCSCLDAASREAAVNRVRSEYESYPATLANVLAQGPCYQDTLRSCHHERNKTLTIHIVGASEDAELSQGPAVTNNDRTSLCKDYAEALAELADQNKLEHVVLYFVGPDCPCPPWEESVLIQNLEKHVGTLTIRTVKGLYNQQTLIDAGHADAIADLVVLFNPGFTCPDYPHWKETLSSIAEGIPFLSTTNTEMEGIADCQFLLDQDKIQTLPLGLADILGVYSEGDESSAFFAVNPSAGTRVRQNLTMANDLFVKNRWMLGGMIGSFDPSANKAPCSVKKVKGATNSKAGNPALI